MKCRVNQRLMVSAHGLKILWKILNFSLKSLLNPQFKKRQVRESNWPLHQGVDSLEMSLLLMYFACTSLHLYFTEFTYTSLVLCLYFTEFPYTSLILHLYFSYTLLYLALLVLYRIHLYSQTLDALVGMWVCVSAATTPFPNTQTSSSVLNLICTSLTSWSH